MFVCIFRRMHLCVYICWVAGFDDLDSLFFFLYANDCFYYYKKLFSPSIEGLCAQIHYFRFEIVGGLRSHLLLFFFERKKM